MNRELYSNELNEEQKYLMLIYDAYEEEYKLLDKQVLELFMLMKSRRELNKTLLNSIDEKFVRKMNVEQQMNEIERTIFRVLIEKEEFSN
ncbi:hypothetical protein QYF48_16255 [Brevibacillus agri]|uniref:hypothetical protein n=1 Tax=Brevibacillus agri TaxID=51101 RepID=UPI0025B71F8A|nr:hypothetical protein [Brevibacillus agri]MDN4094362.1 hypothetical protein [Brevibacillus agri]